MVVRKRRRISASEIDTIRVRGLRDMVKRRGLHAGEVMVGPTGGREGGRIGDAAAPLEDECYGR